MLTKSLIPVARRLVAINRACISTSSARLSGGHDVDHHHGPPPPLFLRQPTMDDLPKPVGPWQEYYDKDQRKYNVVLLAGIASITVTLFALYQSKIFWNLMTPDKPCPPEERYKF